MDYLISTELGDDANPGTTDAPWRTLARASAHIYERGDHIVLMGDERYPGTLRLTEANVVPNPEQNVEGWFLYIMGSDHLPDLPPPVIEAGDGDGISIHNIGQVYISTVTVEGSGYATNQGWGVRVINDKPGNERLGEVEVYDVKASGFRWAGIYVGGVCNDLPAFPAPEGCKYGFDPVAISGCEAHDNMYYGIYVSGALAPDMTEHANRNVIINHCKTWDNPGDKHYTRNHSGSGILLDNCAGGLIEHCESWNNGGENGGLTGGPCGIWAHCGDRITIRHCKSYENRTAGTHDGAGFDFDGGVTNSVIEFCESWDNDGAGYLMWNYKNAPFTLSGNIIRDCVSVNDGRKHGYGGIHIGTSGEPIRDIWVRNNRVTQSPAPSDTPSCVWLGGKHNENIVLRGNTFTATGGVPEIVYEGGAAGVTVVP